MCVKKLSQDLELRKVIIITETNTLANAVSVIVADTTLFTVSDLRGCNNEHRRSQVDFPPKIMDRLPTEKN